MTYQEEINALRDKISKPKVFRLTVNQDIFTTQISTNNSWLQV